METDNVSLTIDDNKKTYAVDDNYNRVEVYSKNDVDNKKQSKILSGTSVPSNDFGEDGDIYLQYDE